LDDGRVNGVVDQDPPFNDSLYSGNSHEGVISTVTNGA
jgi:hypothetical protein